MMLLSCSAVSSNVYNILVFLAHLNANGFYVYKFFFVCVYIFIQACIIRQENTKCGAYDSYVVYEVACNISVSFVFVFTYLHTHTHTHSLPITYNLLCTTVLNYCCFSFLFFSQFSVSLCFGFFFLLFFSCGISCHKSCFHFFFIYSSKM